MNFVQLGILLIGLLKFCLASRLLLIVYHDFIGLRVLIWNYRRRSLLTHSTYHLTNFLKAFWYIWYFLFCHYEWRCSIVVSLLMMYFLLWISHLFLKLIFKLFGINSIFTRLHLLAGNCHSICYHLINSFRHQPIDYLHFLHLI